MQGKIVQSTNMLQYNQHVRAIMKLSESLQIRSDEWFRALQKCERLFPGSITLHNIVAKGPCNLIIITFWGKFLNWLPTDTTVAATGKEMEEARQWLTTEQIESVLR